MAVHPIQQAPTLWPRELADDYAAFDRILMCSLFLMGTWTEGLDLTVGEKRSGWRTAKHQDHEHRVAVGWRAKKRQQEAERKRELEMAACPYVACECGHHEETY